MLNHSRPAVDPRYSPDPSHPLVEGGCIAGQFAMTAPRGIAAPMLELLDKQTDATLAALVVGTALCSRPLQPRAALIAALATLELAHRYASGTASLPVVVWGETFRAFATSPEAVAGLTTLRDQLADELLEMGAPTGASGAPSSGAVH